MRYAAFLRGINVGRSHRVTNDELRTHFEAMEFSDVETFRASGNVAFTSTDEASARLTARIEERLATALGYSAATFLRDSSEMQAIARVEPLVNASAGKLQVALLSARPAAKVRRSVLELATENDALAFSELELYWLPSGGISDSALELKKIDALLGPMTMRTKGTVEQMVARYFKD
jgi:uncharacterized protein (DUF1697 family)